MGKTTPWITPFKKQCFVTLGMSLNMAMHGIVMGYSSMLLPQLRKPDSIIQIDASASSWIASIPSIFQVLGNMVAAPLMGQFGRRRTNLFSITIMVATWLTVSAAGNLSTLLICRGIQGFSMGISATLAPVLIGEYTSPPNRGAFLTTISLAMAVGVLTVHTLGSFLPWQWCALIVSIICFVNLLIVINSPESPSWLADRGEYAESRKIFKWLRGDEEDEDLKRMIDGSIVVRNERESKETSETCGQKIKSTFVQMKTAFRKKEFYKPILIMIHVYSIGVCCGAVLLTAFLVDLIEIVIYPNYHVALLAITLGITRLTSNILAVYLIKKFKRRGLMFATCGLNTLVLFIIAIYTYARSHNMLPFDSPFIGISLMILHMFSATTGGIPFPFIIAGELFPLEYKNLASGISVIYFSSTFFVMVKTIPYCLSTIGLHGTFLTYGVFMSYSLIISFLFLPETKDRTLEDIEDEFRGRKLSPIELKSIQSLSSVNKHKPGRRCSSPLI